MQQESHSMSFASRNLVSSCKSSASATSSYTGTVQQYFTEKREASRGQPLQCHSDMGTTMSFDDTYGKKHNRGIKAHQEAKFNHWNQRAKHLKAIDDKRKLERKHKKEAFESTKSVREELKKKEDAMEAYMEQKWKEASEPTRIVVTYDINTAECNDAW